MTQAFIITGMTCNGCRTSVESILSKVEGVQSAVVHLENETAILESTTELTSDILETLLPEKYTVTQKEDTLLVDKDFLGPTQLFESTNKGSSPTREVSKFVQLKPLFLILGYVAIASILLHYKDRNVGEAMLDFMGLFYIVFSFFKMLDVKGFGISFQMYDPLAKRVPLYGKVYPFIETALGLMFLMRFQVDIALVLTICLLGITTIGVTKTLLDKNKIQCACLGTALKLPMTEATFIENAIMIGMAILMITKMI